MRLERRHIPVRLFVGAYMGVAAYFAVVQGNREFVFYGIIMLVLIVLVLLMDLRVRLATPLLWGLAAWGLAHMAGGTVKIPETWAEPGSVGTLYNLRVHPWLPKYDQVVHCLGFGLATLAGWRGLCVASRGSGPQPRSTAVGDPTLRPTFGVLIGVICVGMGLGAINEVIEFAATRIMPNTNVGGFENTGWDLVSNLVGCVLAAVFIRGTHATRPRAGATGSVDSERDRPGSGTTPAP